MLEGIIVVGVVAVVAAMTGRSFYRTMAGKNDGCGCAGNCQGCACRDFAEMDQGRDTKK
ncbi:MAG: FeoB-associated Cys-rich membrane protein [Deltaproteobacteria bacterium]|nr:FeoB-associated Cys-rich membrane protein [Deltaproteobacteria bacterium]MBW2104230.1 FeoB-associated Cys-rich membrane protein [Deltaproteobacteria bacterium]